MLVFTDIVCQDVDNGFPDIVYHRASGYEVVPAFPGSTITVDRQGEFHVVCNRLVLISQVCDPLTNVILYFDRIINTVDHVVVIVFRCRLIKGG